jgi:hypothetical protein
VEQETRHENDCQTQTEPELSQEASFSLNSS